MGKGAGELSLGRCRRLAGRQVREAVGRRRGVLAPRGRRTAACPLPPLPQVGGRAQKRSLSEDAARTGGCPFVAADLWTPVEVRRQVFRPRSPDLGGRGGTGLSRRDYASRRAFLPVFHPAGGSCR